MVVSSPRPNGANSSINGAVNRSSPKNLVKVNGVKPQVSSSKPSPLANGSSSKVPQSPGKVLSAISNLESTISADNVAPQTSRSRPATPCDATFIVRAATHFGDTVHLARGERQERPSELYCEREGVWTTTAKFEVPADLSTVRFGHAHANSPIHWQRTPRAFPVPPLSESRGNVLILEDADESMDSALQSAAFKDVIFRRRSDLDSRSRATAAARARNAAVVTAAKNGGVALVLGVRAPRVESDHHVYAVGNVPALGNGDTSKALRLDDSNAPSWSICVAVARTDLNRGLEYRFIIKDAAGSVVADEGGVRLVHVTTDRIGEISQGTAPVVLSSVNTSFRYETQWKGAGIALPVFSIRSNSSCGVGEFNDLTKIVDLCVATGHQLLQLLPVNDTTCYGTARDSYPYSAVSCFALHPQYLNIESIVSELPATIKTEYDAECARLNALPEIDYVEVMRVKDHFIRLLYALEKHEFLTSPEFQQWFSEQQQWLVPYALYRFFMQVNGTSIFDKWGERASLTASEMEKFAAPDSFHFDYLGMVYYTQFHLHKQLSAASDYASKNQVVFKGDLPIGVNRYCADTWLNPHLFHLHMQAGAPPDYFSQNGQNWGFPTYNWEAMKADGYAWWRLRLGHMAKYFHAYRIDHILGFFRIWEIPQGFRTGMRGRFRPVHGMSRGEIEGRGLWDFDRYTMPYVRDGLLQECLGHHDDWWRVKERFFHTMWEDRLRFKDEFDNEEKVYAALELPEDAPEHEKEFNKKVKDALTHLLNNVCLLVDVENSDLFHPRFMLTNTSSFRELPSDEWKSIFSDIHEDYFFRRQEELWRNSAMEKLPMMKEASDMLVCGEDLGLVPACVPWVMEKTGILSLAVQRMPPGDAEFGYPPGYVYDSVASTSSHDVSTLRGWWAELDTGAKKRYWNDILKRSGEAPERCDGGLVETVLEQHMKSPAMWIVTPIQDLLGMDEKMRRKVAEEEQINDPANPLHVWKFRMHVNADEILANKALVEKMTALTRGHGRGRSY